VVDQGRARCSRRSWKALHLDAGGISAHGGTADTKSEYRSRYIFRKGEMMKYQIQIGNKLHILLMRLRFLFDISDSTESVWFTIPPNEIIYAVGNGMW
jgi:hypothetical protein